METNKQAVINKPQVKNKMLTINKIRQFFSGLKAMGETKLKVFIEFIPMWGFISKWKIIENSYSLYDYQADIERLIFRLFSKPSFGQPPPCMIVPYHGPHFGFYTLVEMMIG